MNPVLVISAQRENAGQAPLLSAQEAPTSVPIVAGVHDHRAPSGYKPDEVAGLGVCPMQPPRRCTTHHRPVSGRGPEKLPARINLRVRLCGRGRKWPVLGYNEMNWSNS